MMITAETQRYFLRRTQRQQPAYHGWVPRCVVIYDYAFSLLLDYLCWIVLVCDGH